MLSDLPLALLGAVFRCLAALDDLGRLAPTLNLVCRAAHEALPDAFTSLEPAPSHADGSSSSSSPDLPDPTLDLHSPDQWCAFTPVLQLHLARLGRAALNNRVQSSSLRRTGQRFAKSRCVCVIAADQDAVHGSALFAQHVAREMVGVRTLLVFGPATRPIIPFWQLSTFTGMSAGVRELHLDGHHSTLAPLAAQMPEIFPALTSLRLVLFADDYDARMLLVPIATGFSALSVRVSPRLTSLLLSVKMPDNEERGFELDGDPFTLTITGDPSSLRRLHVDMWETTKDVSDYAFVRPWALVGALPALLHLDATVCPDYYGADGANGEAGRHPFGTPLLEACPPLRSLLLRTNSMSGMSAWAPFVAALAPLSATLRSLELLVPLPRNRLGNKPLSEVMPPHLRRVLPLARLSVVEEPL